MLCRGEKRNRFKCSLRSMKKKKEAYQKKIEHYQSKITEIDAQIKNLMDAQKQKELEHLMDLIREAGKTPEDIIRSLKQP